MINKWLFLSQGITLGLFLFFQCDHVKKRYSMFEALAWKKVTKPIQHLSFVGAPRFPWFQTWCIPSRINAPMKTIRYTLLNFFIKSFLAVSLSFSTGEGGMYNMNYYWSIEEQLKQRQGIDITPLGIWRPGSLRGLAAQIVYLWCLCPWHQKACQLLMYHDQMHCRFCHQHDYDLACPLE